MAVTLETLRTAIEYAPLAGPVAPELVGVWTTEGFFLCAICVGRLIGRGCGHLTHGEQVWEEDVPQITGVCATCAAQNIGGSN